MFCFRSLIIVTKKNLEYFIYNYSEKLIKTMGNCGYRLHLYLSIDKIKVQIHESGLGGGFWCLSPLSTIFQLYRGGSMNLKIK